MLVGELLVDLPDYRLARGDRLRLQHNYANLGQYIVMDRIADGFVPTGRSASDPSASVACVVPKLAVALEAAP